MSKENSPRESDDEEINFLEIEEQNSNESKTLMSNSDKNDCDLKWILDSGASVHVINDKISLKNIEKLNPPVRLSTAKSGAYLEAYYKGDIDFVTNVNGKEKMFTVNSVLSVPELNSNLLSVGKLEEYGFKVIFHKGSGYIKRGNEIVAVAFRNISKTYSLLGKLIEDSLCKYHKKMSGLNIDSMNFKSEAEILNRSRHKNSRKGRINERNTRRRKVPRCFKDRDI